MHQAYSFLTSMFASAMFDELIPATPCARVNLPEIHKHRVFPYDANQVEHLVDALPPWYRALGVLGAATGMRGAEMRGLTHDRIRGGDAIVDRQLIDIRNGRPVFGPPKWDAGDRRLALGRIAGDAIADHLDAYGPGVDGLVFVTRQGGPISRQRSGEAWHGVLRRLSVDRSLSELERQFWAAQEAKERSGWHELRHHHASLLINAGMNAKAVAERLGHADEAETGRTYAHLWPADHARMAQIADAALAGLAASRDGVVVPLRRA